MTSREKQPVQRERNAAHTQKALLDAAEEVFAQSGFDGARLDLIAKRSGYNIALLYRYFENKEGIYQAVIERLRTQESASLRQVITPFITNEAAIHDPEQVRAFLEKCCTWYFYLASRHPSLLRLLDWQVETNRNPFPDVAAAGEEEQWGEAAVAFLQRAQAVGHLRANLDVRQILINMFLLSTAHVSFLPPAAEMEEDVRKKMLEDLCQKVVEMILYGVFPTPEQKS